ncbi:hypothetical protein C8R45DRAFT_935008 [Mycena sanguinolenta]|nr:hypothetical protein C8R45DRAFT_935008 [Mycena sanguinolenta]
MAVNIQKRKVQLKSAIESPGLSLSLGLEALSEGLGLGFRFLKPKPAQAGPKPGLPGQAGPLDSLLGRRRSTRKAVILQLPPVKSSIPRPIKSNHAAHRAPAPVPPPIEPASRDQLGYRAARASIQTLPGPSNQIMRRIAAPHVPPLIEPASCDQLGYCTAGASIQALPGASNHAKHRGPAPVPPPIEPASCDQLGYRAAGTSIPQALASEESAPAAACLRHLFSRAASTSVFAHCLSLSLSVPAAPAPARPLSIYSTPATRSGIHAAYLLSSVGALLDACLRPLYTTLQDARDVPTKHASTGIRVGIFRFK